MTAFRLAKGEFQRITAGRLPKLAVVALALVPLLYGALYLYANWDPYGKLKDVPAALVVADTGSGDLRAGEKVADKLANSDAFEWHRVSAAEAETGVRDGKYTFSLTLPADFSAALASPGKFEPKQGTLILTTNDANNYIVRTIADKVVSEVRRAVAADAGTEAADRLLMGFSTLRDKTLEAADGAGKLADGSKKVSDGVGTAREKINELHTGLGKLADGADTLAAKNGELATGLGTMKEKTAPLPGKTQQLADGAAKVADGNAQLAQKAGTVAEGAQHLVDFLGGKKEDLAKRLREIGLAEEQVQRVLAAVTEAGKPVRDANDKIQGAVGQVKQLADGSKQVADGAKTLATSSAELTGKIGEAADGAKKLADGAKTLRDGVHKADDGSGKLYTGTAELQDGAKKVADGNGELHGKLAEGAGQIPNPDDETRKATARTIGDPVAIRAVGENQASNYGSGLAPFFLGLALWIGAFVLFLLLRPLSKRALASGASPLRVALGGWLPAALLGAVQTALLFGVVTLALGIEPARPWGVLGFMLLTSLAFTAVLHGLNALLGPAGKFVGLVLLVLQLTTAGGTFPWQTVPDPLKPLHLILPLSYVVDGMRHLLYGGGLNTVWEDVTVLSIYLVLGLALSTLAAYKQRVWTPTKLKPELVL
ncbi:YhgE/Pip domain-containing protein [Crossiella cryophila]|uniref:Putative membrane protein n=1 Tax=Crossiella cryophila TaxID=43355 RepID=A0A7W7CK14_9PSEU|nr:YhgE/Pip domain-containing protein [Crossiella cryophila]MBB4681226.1 putative membrane protein [Crossiella cryophila]